MKVRLLVVKNLKSGKYKAQLFAQSHSWIFSTKKDYLAFVNRVKADIPGIMVQKDEQKD